MMECDVPSYIDVGVGCLVGNVPTIASCAVQVDSRVVGELMVDVEHMPRVVCASSRASKTDCAD